MLSFWLQIWSFYLSLWLLCFQVANNHPRNLKKCIFSEDILYLLKQNILSYHWQSVFFSQNTLKDSEADWPWTTLWKTLIGKITLFHHFVFVCIPMTIHSTQVSKLVLFFFFIFNYLIFHFILALFFYPFKCLTINFWPEGFDISLWLSH